MRYRNNKTLSYYIKSLLWIDDTTLCLHVKPSDMNIVWFNRTYSNYSVLFK